jgi:hypothetical protein
VKTLEFNGIKTILNNYINQSAELTELCVVDDHIAFDHLTIGQAKELTVKARDLQSKTDQFLKQDLYHIIGMGNLSASQSAALNKLVKDITAYRTVVKTVAAFPSLPNAVHKISIYKSTTFGLKLKNKTFVKN